MSSATPQPATRDRLVQAAIELIANEGAQAATVRRVADAVGVSAPLVLHHFGSKEGLVAACDERVLGTMEGMLAEMAAAGADAGFQYLMADEQAAVLLLYVARALHEDNATGRQWFDRLYALTRNGMAEMAERGMVRTFDDPVMASLILLAMDLGLVLLRPHVERILDAPLTDRSVVTRWITAEFDLLTTPIFRPPASPAAPAPDSEQP